MSKKTGVTWQLQYRIAKRNGTFGRWHWASRVFRNERAVRKEFEALSVGRDMELRIVRGETIEELKQQKQPKPKRKVK